MKALKEVFVGFSVVFSVLFVLYWLGRLWIYIFDTGIDPSFGHYFDSIFMGLLSVVVIFFALIGVALLGVLGKSIMRANDNE